MLPPRLVLRRSFSPSHLLHCAAPSLDPIRHVYERHQFSGVSLAYPFVVSPSCISGHGIRGSSIVDFFIFANVSLQYQCALIHNASHKDMIVVQNKAYMRLFTENFRLMGSLQTLEYAPYFLGGKIPLFNFLQESVQLTCKWSEQVVP
jgi:hypothetical protein